VSDPSWARVDSNFAPLVVFAQRADVSIDIDAWNAHATRFFATRIGFAELPPNGSVSAAARDRHDRGAGADDGGAVTARFVVAPEGDTPGIRRAFVRLRDDQDLAPAEAADARVGATGLALLARRCSAVWLVERTGSGDRIALRLATVLASILLGPILDTTGGELFGLKTARQKFEKD